MTYIYIYIDTRTTESLAAIARISAQDTVSGQTYSRSAFIASITSNPLSEFAFGAALFSPTNPGGMSSSNTDASHPWKQKPSHELINYNMPCTNNNIIKKSTSSNTCINEAIVEMESKQRGGHSGIVIHGPFDPRKDDRLGLGACV